MRLIAVLLLGCFPPGLLAQDLPVISDLSRPGPSAEPHAPRASSHLLGALQVSALGLVGTAAFSLADQRDRTTEVVVGIGRVHSSFVPATLIDGTLYTRALHLVPVYLGMRVTLARGGGSPVSWNWYLRGGAGPAFGFLTPMGLEFFDALRATTVHWGLGVYAATGLEFVVDNSLAVFVQLGADGVGFVRPIEDRSTLIGPSVSFGVGRLLP
jgi:hypothetical protein